MLLYSFIGAVVEKWRNGDSLSSLKFF